MIKTVFIDMDGVTVDWLTAMTTALGKDMSLFQGHENMSGDEKWKFCEEHFGDDHIKKVMSQPGFWVLLKKLPWADELIDVISKHFQVAFLSKPSKEPASAYGKVVWQQQNYPQIPLILCENKGLVASPDKFLIDDDNRQYDRFEKAGGYGWLFPNQLWLAAKTKEQQNMYIQAILMGIYNIP